MLIISSHKKLLLVISVIIFVAGLMVWLTQIKVAEINSELNSPASNVSTETEPNPITAPIDSAEQAIPQFQEENNQLEQVEFTFTASEAQTAEELLDQSATVEYQDFGTAGKFVQSINGVASNEYYFWGFYVNGEFAEFGVSQTELEPGDTITFRYEKIEPLQ